MKMNAKMKNTVRALVALLALAPAGAAWALHKDHTIHDYWWVDGVLKMKTWTYTQYWEWYVTEPAWYDEDYYAQACDAWCEDAGVKVADGTDASLGYVRIDATGMTAGSAKMFFAIYNGTPGQRTTIYAVEGDYMP